MKNTTIAATGEENSPHSAKSLLLRHGDRWLTKESSPCRYVVLLLMNILLPTKGIKLFIIFLFMNTTSNAQTKPASVAGEYYLEGVMETASGFQLNKDSSFQFFFSYGALDRYGKGKWSVKDNAVVFESPFKPAQDFKLVQRLAAKSGKTSIQIKNLHPHLLQHVYCIAKSGSNQAEGMTNSKGVVTFNLQKIDTIELLLEFCPEKKSVFKFDATSAQELVFEPEPWLMEVFFQNFRLQLTEKGLTGGHPLSDKNNFHYHKN